MKDVRAECVYPLRRNIVGVGVSIFRKIRIDLIGLPFGLVESEPSENFILAREVMIHPAEILTSADNARDGAACGEVQRIQLLEVRERKVLVDHIQCAFVEARGRDDIPIERQTSDRIVDDDRRPDRSAGGWIIGRIQETREIAAPEVLAGPPGCRDALLGLLALLVIK